MGSGNRVSPAIMKCLNESLVTKTDYILQPDVNLDCSRRQYSLVVKTIPVALIDLIKGVLQYSSVIPIAAILFDNYNFFDGRCNKIMFSHFLLK